MAKYRVKVRVVQHEFYEIEADSAEEAMENYAEGELYDTDTEECQAVSATEE